MRLPKMLLLKLVILFMTLVLCHPGFSQIKKGAVISFTGVIDSIPQDSKFIVANERRVFISSNTIITGERGGTLTVDDLRIRLHVTIEGVQKSDGIHAKKITVMKTPQKRP
jgi:hypothetical protein